MKRALQVLSLLAIVLCVSSVHASAASGVPSGETGRSLPDQLDIAIQRNYARQFTYDSVYETMPSVTAPYAAGSLTDEYLQSGFAWFNYIRYVAGLPAGTLVPEWNELSQYGAVLLGSIDTLTHTPGKPSDMPQDFYEKGYEATSSANISYRYGYGPQNQLISSLEGCMSDNSTSNRSLLGHRRWLLNPLPEMQIGFGQADAESGSTYVVTKVFDNGSYWQQETIDYQYVAWPSSGSFPTELITMQDPWSVTLNPDLYQRPNINQVSVTITRSSDGRTWHFSSGSSDGFFTVNTGNYGVSNCIIFQTGQNNWGTGEFDGVYHVSVSGLTTVDGKAAELSYDVDFFDVSAVALPEYDLDVSASSGGTVSLSAQTVTAGSNAAFSVTPDSGYRTFLVRINGQIQPIQEDYAIQCVTGDTKIEVLFEDMDTGTISDGVLLYSAEPDGTLTVAGLADQSTGGALAVPAEYAGLPVTAIGASAFAGSGITSIHLPDSIRTIGARAFQSSGITGTMTIPSSVTAIGEYSFSYLRNVTEFEMEENQSYVCQDGVLFQKDGGGQLSVLMNYPLASGRTDYVVPKDVTLLFCTSFADAKNLKNLYVPGRQVRAMTYTFYGCGLTLFGRTGTTLQEQLPDLTGEVAFVDIEREPVLTLKDGVVRYINLGGPSAIPNLILAGYDEAEKMTDVRLLEDVAAAEDSVVFLDAGRFEAPVLKFFLLDNELIPLDQPVVSQRPSL